jgi:predicted secreted protein
MNQGDIEISRFKGRMGQLDRVEQLADGTRHQKRRNWKVNPQLVSSATLNNFLLSTIVFATVVSAMILGICSGYVTVSGILRAMNRRPAKARANIIEFPANVAS